MHKAKGTISVGTTRAQRSTALLARLLDSKKRMTPRGESHQRIDTLVELLLLE